MKELYISPELNLLCLAPQEKLMSGEQTVDYDSLLNPYGQDTAVSADVDIDIDIPL